MPDKKTILLVEDNKQLSQINQRALARIGYNVLTALNLAQAREHLKQEEPDTIILDIMLPDGNGVDFCREIRERIAAPILFLTSVSGYAQTLEGLAAGGDDYLNKPFDLNLLLAKVEAFLRRDEIMERVRFSNNRLVKGSLTLDIMTARAYLRNTDILLTQKEFALLLLLVQNEGKALSGETIYESVWRQSMTEDANALKNAVSRLRKKMAESSYQITAVRGCGYRFEEIE